MNADVIPPAPPGRTTRTAAVGLAACVVAAVVGLGLDANAAGGPGPLSTLRLVAVGLGLLAAGGAVSLRPDRPVVWLLAAGAALAGRFGLPAHWDSIRTVSTVAAGAAAFGGLLAAVPFRTRVLLGSAPIVYHFFGIFLATTWPSPTPWVTDQLGTRFYQPYLKFLYLTNAYHFYSPEPGPASLIYALVRYELDEPATDPKTGAAVTNPDGTPKKKVAAEWLVLPSRSNDMKDPLGMTYYRRLSITEQISQTIPDYVTPSAFEKLDVRVRRYKVASGDYSGQAAIPLAPDEIEQPISQYKMPYPSITRYLLPSYAKHLLTANAAPGYTPLTVKLYRVEHRIIPVTTFRQGVTPFHPITYRPFYLGEFALNAQSGLAELTNPQDPMLYWLVPILPKMMPGTGETVEAEIDDYLSKHAGVDVNWRRK